MHAPPPNETSSSIYCINNSSAEKKFLNPLEITTVNEFPN